MLGSCTIKLIVIRTSSKVFSTVGQSGPPTFRVTLTFASVGGFPVSPFYRLRDTESEVTQCQHARISLPTKPSCSRGHKVLSPNLPFFQVGPQTVAERRRGEIRPGLRPSASSEKAL